MNNDYSLDNLTLKLDNKPLNQAIHFSSNGTTTIFKIDPNGQFEYSGTPNEGTKAFLDALPKIYPIFRENILNQRVIELVGQLAEAKEEKAQLLNKLAEYEAQIQSLKDSVANLGADLDNSDRALARADREVGCLEDEVSNLKEEIRALERNSGNF